ncbi:MAG: serine/threonine-protein kinase, partial [Planctomycetota bacterium]
MPFFEWKDIFLARISMEQGFLSRDSVEKIFALLEKEKEKISFEEYLKRSQILPKKFLQIIFSLYQERNKHRYGLTCEDIEDYIFANLLLEKGLVDKKNLLWAMNRQKILFQGGRFPRLWEILDKAKVLSFEEMEDILIDIKSQILICPSCHRRYNIQSLKSGQQFPCLKCSKILQISFSQGSKQSPSSPGDLTFIFQNPDSNSQTDIINFINSCPQESKGNDSIRNTPIRSNQKKISQKSPNPNQSSLLDYRDKRGLILNKYKIIQKIGKGGVGIVYKALDVTLNRMVALKTLIAGENATGTTIQRFLLEAKATAKIRHSNIVTIHEVGQVGPFYFFSMEFVDGQPFDRFIYTNPKVEDIVKIMIKICEALHFAHQKGIIHRDLKPSNIIIKDHLDPVVMDFGLAKLMDEDTNLTQTGTTLGTPTYMPPEQAAGFNDSVDSLSDIYSLGAILYEAVTKQKPFDGPTYVSIIYKVLSTEPTLPRDINPSIPKPLEKIILKAMSKEKNLRYSSAGEMARDLRRYLQGESIHVKLPNIFQKGWKNFRKAPFFSSVVIFLFLFCIFMGIFLFYKNYNSALLLNGKELALIAQKEFEAGKLDKAQKLYEKARQLGYFDSNLCIHLSQIYLKYGNFPLCKKYLLEGIQKYPKNTTILYLLGEFHKKQQKYFLSIQAYNKAIEENPLFLKPYIALRDLYLKLGKKKEYQNLVRRFRKILKNKAGQLLKQAILSVEKEKWFTAIQLLQQAAGYDSTNPSIFYYLALCHFHLFDWEGAVQNISKASQLDPQNNKYLVQR